MKNTIMLWALALLAFSTHYCAAQSSSSGRLQIDTRASYEFTGLLYGGLGLEYTLLQSPKWETGLRIGGLATPIDDRISTGEKAYWWVSSDLLLYRRLSKNIRILIGLGGSHGTRAFKWNARGSVPYLYGRTMYLYGICGLRAYPMGGPLFIQLQLKAPPVRWPHYEVWNYGLLEFSLGLRFGHKDK
ncbi:MAG: hypothetical protein AAFN10_03150 [Bacteroidota bacterium]